MQHCLLEIQSLVNSHKSHQTNQNAKVYTPTVNCITKAGIYGKK